MGTRFVAFVAAIIALFGAACGGSDNQVAPPPPAGTTNPQTSLPRSSPTTQATAAALDPCKLVLPSDLRTVWGVAFDKTTPRGNVCVHYGPNEQRSVEAGIFAANLTTRPASAVSTPEFGADSYYTGPSAPQPAIYIRHGDRYVKVVADTRADSVSGCGSQAVCEKLARLVYPRLPK